MGKQKKVNARQRSYARRTFFDRLLEIPIIGRPAHNLLKRKGRIVQKSGGVALIVIIVVVLVWLNLEPRSPNTATQTVEANNDSQVAQTNSSSNVVHFVPSNLQPRHLSDAQKKQLLAVIEKLPVGEFELEVDPKADDGKAFAQDLGSVFLAAGWKFNGMVPAGNDGLPPEIGIGLGMTGNGGGNISKEIADSLSRMGLTASVLTFGHRRTTNVLCITIQRQESR
jgi:hypothetical protein